MNTLETGKKQIMRRIYFVWTLRTVFSPTSIKLMAFTVLLWQLSVHIFVKQVIANWTFGPGLTSGYVFFQSAFLHTALINQILLAGMGVVVLLLARDMLRINGRHLVRTLSARI